ncbi:hypothetical protein AK812_SmicGene24265 [Symbiodinium microadriaticum]|uniref:Uncharacterized protein n=1 Tax=Symbiodinium microadriaticum TaxID=2951 RepID=A0A1Q9DF46_SYMMI|nr:hypothetical protein AK812_SmicGene24265 [Symbiodinium microadriaticum]
MCYYSSETRSRRRAKTTPASILKGGRFLYADFDHIETPPITRPRVRFNAVVTISAIPARHAEEFAATPCWQASKSRRFWSRLRSVFFGCLQKPRLVPVGPEKCFFDLTEAHARDHDWPSPQSITHAESTRRSQRSAPAIDVCWDQFIMEN